MEERDIMEVDVLFVGGGIACLSGALHLANLIKEHNQKIEDFAHNITISFQLFLLIQLPTRI